MLKRDKMEREDLITITLTKYEEPQWKFFRRMFYPVCDRFAIDFGYYSIIIELSFLRK